MRSAHSRGEPCPGRPAGPFASPVTTASYTPPRLDAPPEEVFGARRRCSAAGADAASAGAADLTAQAPALVLRWRSAARLLLSSCATCSGHAAGRRTPPPGGASNLGGVYDAVHRDAKASRDGPGQGSPRPVSAPIEPLPAAAFRCRLREPGERTRAGSGRPPWQDHERVQAGRGQDDHPVRVRLLQSLEQHSLILVTQPPDVGNECNSASSDGRLEVEKCLQRQLVKLGRFVGSSRISLIDSGLIRSSPSSQGGGANELRAGEPLPSAWLRLTYPAGLANEKICMRERPC